MLDTQQSLRDDIRAGANVFAFDAVAFSFALGGILCAIDVSNDHIVLAIGRDIEETRRYFERVRAASDETTPQ